MPDPNTKRDKALDDISHSLKSLVRIQTAMNENLVYIGRLLKPQIEDINVGGDTNATE